MRKLGLAKRKNFYRKFVGKSMPLLIETKRDSATGFLKGMSSNYLPVLIEGKDNQKNKIIDVTIEKMERGSLFGSHAV